MKRNFLAAAVAGLALLSGPAHAADVTFTWDYVGVFNWLTFPGCTISAGCFPNGVEESGTYQLTLPDDTTSATASDYHGIGVDVISFETSNGRLISFDEVRDLGGSENSHYHLSLTGTGGYSWYEGFAGPQQGPVFELLNFYEPGTEPPATLSVPEPTTALLMLAGLSLLAFRRRASR